MAISDGMRAKANRMIAEDSLESYRQANMIKGAGGKWRKRKKHRPYRIPNRAKLLLEALGRNDAEAVASIMMYSQPGDKL